MTNQSKGCDIQCIAFDFVLLKVLELEVTSFASGDKNSDPTVWLDRLATVFRFAFGLFTIVWHCWNSLQNLKSVVQDLINLVLDYVAVMFLALMFKAFGARERFLVLLLSG